MVMRIMSRMDHDGERNNSRSTCLVCLLLSLNCLLVEEASSFRPKKKFVSTVNAETTAF
jgi:hypothetical protein